MTTFRVMSDLHFEFHSDGGRAFAEALDVEPDEILLCAGDLTSGHRLPAALSLLCERFAHVVYVAGNHEFYGATRTQVDRWICDAMSEHNNFHPLSDHSLRVQQTSTPPSATVPQ